MDSTFHNSALTVAHNAGCIFAHYQQNTGQQVHSRALYTFQNNYQQIAQQLVNKYSVLICAYNLINLPTDHICNLSVEEAESAFFKELPKYL